MQVTTIQHSNNKVFVFENWCHAHARVQGEERIQPVLSVAGNTNEEFAIGIITDTGENVECLAR